MFRDFARFFWIISLGADNLRVDSLKGSFLVGSIPKNYISSCLIYLWRILLASFEFAHLIDYIILEYLFFFFF